MTYRGTPPWAGIPAAAAPPGGAIPSPAVLQWGDVRYVLVPDDCADPTANACKIVDFHGEKIASFSIHGKTMLCLPQAFEIFLKNLVGGLHTVYTKCKRLGINPLVHIERKAARDPEITRVHPCSSSADLGFAGL